jgi:hypothetical protein
MRQGYTAERLQVVCRLAGTVTALATLLMSSPVGAQTPATGATTGTKAATPTTTQPGTNAQSGTTATQPGGAIAPAGTTGATGATTGAVRGTTMQGVAPAGADSTGANNNGTGGRGLWGLLGLLGLLGMWRRPAVVVEKTASYRGPNTTTDRPDNLNRPV